MSTKQVAVDESKTMGIVRFEEPMSRHTSWRVGGPAQRFLRPASVDELARFLRSLPPTEPIVWVGLGSNLLVRDGGIRGTVVSIAGMLNRLKVLSPNIVWAEAGVPCAKVARFAARSALNGAEFLAGIPGTMGGALAMNAGAFGSEVWERVVAIQTLHRSGEVRNRFPRDYEIDYRSVNGPDDEWFISCELRLEPGDARQSSAKIRELLAARSRTQPTGQASCGSVFRNPPGDYAARLIEAAGLKGVGVGGARVSTKHANFILNTGNATAADIENLMQQVMHSVEQTHGIRLVPEVRIIGDAI